MSLNADTIGTKMKNKRTSGLKKRGLSTEMASKMGMQQSDVRVLPRRNCQSDTGIFQLVQQDSPMCLIFNSKFPPKVYACANSHRFRWTTNWKIPVLKIPHQRNISVLINHIKGLFVPSECLLLFFWPLQSCFLSPYQALGRPLDVSVKHGSCA